jgi:hypothetical protein
MYFGRTEQSRAVARPALVCNAGSTSKAIFPMRQPYLLLTTTQEHGKFESTSFFGRKKTFLRSARNNAKHLVLHMYV